MPDRIIPASLSGTGIILAAAQSFDLGAFTAGITTVGLAGVGVWSYYRAKSNEAKRDADAATVLAYRETEAAKLEVEREKLKFHVERDATLKDSLSEQLIDAQADRDAMAAKLESVQSQLDRFVNMMAENTRLTISQGKKMDELKQSVNKMPSVLIVEDDKATSEALVKYLAMNGYTVDFASTVKDAKSKLLSAPHAVILDIMLPDGTGLDVLHEIRKRQMVTKVIVTSAVPPNDQNSALMPDYVMQKPVDWEQLISYLKDKTAPRPHLSDIELITQSGSGIRPAITETSPDLPTIRG